MDPIRKALNEVYDEKHFSIHKKQDTVKLARNVNRKKRGAAVTVAVTVMAAIMLFLLVQPAEQHVSVSTEKAPETVEEAYMERFAAAMVTDDKEAVMTYLSESDWLLQCAIESGDSAFYRSPELTAKERKNLSALLYYMYLWRIEVWGAKPPIPNVASFDELRRQSASFVETYEEFFPDKPFISSKEEHGLLSNTYFGTMSKNNQWGLIGMMAIFGILFILNIKVRGNLFFKAIPLVIICICLVPFVMPAAEKYAYDETSIMEAVLNEEELKGAHLTDAATFGDNRYALITTAEGIHYFAHFLKNENGYVLWYTKTGKEYMMDASQPQWRRQVVAVHEGHDMSKIELVGEYESEGTVIPVDLEAGKPTIRAIVKPEFFKSFHYEYYNANGEKMY
ncbi:hypothetical protein [Lysinibacillus odysseyi]|uniref:Uncharacterized protein n=1 Tax=Lysinibacillus odysseyi 34hs-1 = NBRC 100172 TaxID=1220589 RepID=A0A0A3ISR1_9BACI|nr:hypothetical protein [Lysinibacillus odysseyi]KGR87774.1 hypothetical protein CD32_02960 [Lysinibacillus odysseyi 34hs-1 = NBRC 100172]